MPLLANITKKATETTELGLHVIKAMVVGEIHTSSKNVRKLKRMVESKKYDAVFIEGREDKIFDESVKTGFGYSFFLMGFAEFMPLLKLYARKKSVAEAAEKLGIPVFTKIDASLPVIFTMSNVWIRRALFPLLVALSVFPILWDSLRLGGLIFLIASPIIYFGLLVRSVNEKRDGFMANYIIGKVEANDYGNILVSCGDSHVDGIARHLKQAGMVVDIVKSGGLFRLITKLLVLTIILIAIIFTIFVLLLLV